MTPTIELALKFADKEKKRTGFSNRLQKARVRILDDVYESFKKHRWESMEGSADVVSDYVQFWCDFYGWSINGKNADELLDTGLNFAGNLVGDYAEGGIQ